MNLFGFRALFNEMIMSDQRNWEFERNYVFYRIDAKRRERRAIDVNFIENYLKNWKYDVKQY